MQPGASGTASIEAQLPGVGVEPGCGTLWCDLANAVTPAVVVWTGVATLVLLATVAHVRRAREVCEEEHDRTLAERDAFDRFVRQVSGIETATQGSPAGASAVALHTATGTDSRLESVRTAYRETVMDVSHYDEEYGDALAESVRVELGEDIATAVVEGDQFSPPVKRALVRTATEASARRSEFVHRLETEDDALADGEERLLDLRATLERTARRPLPDRSFEDLVDARERLCAVREECESLLAKRQRAIDADGGSFRGESQHGFYRYLYHPVDATYPVLADGTTLLRDVRRAERNVVASLACRV